MGRFSSKAEPPEPISPPAATPGKRCPAYLEVASAHFHLKRDRLCLLLHRETALEVVSAAPVLFSLKILEMGRPFPRWQARAARCAGCGNPMNLVRITATTGFCERSA